MKPPAIGLAAILTVVAGAASAQSAPVASSRTVPSQVQNSADAALDERIRTQFGALHQAAHAGELAAWRDQPDGRLAEIIVLDQGHILERGSHAELLARGGAYAQMWALQQEEREAEDAPA